MNTAGRLAPKCLSSYYCRILFSTFLLLRNTPEKYASLKPFRETLSSEWNRIQTWSCEEM